MTQLVQPRQDWDSTLAKFFALVFAFSMPLWLLGGVTDLQLMRWLVPVLVLMPAVSFVVYGLMRWLGTPMPAAQFQLFPAMLMFIAFFVGALGEELGWSGYALDPMQERWGALGASVLLGLVGILWHLPPLLLIGRSPTWIAWWCLYALTFRIFAVWLYNNTGRSVFAAALFHATVNMAPSHCLLGPENIDRIKIA